LETVSEDIDGSKTDKPPEPELFSASAWSPFILESSVT